MHENKLQKLLMQVRAGTTSVEEAQESLRQLPFSDLGFARVDHHRQIRQGMPEVVFGEGKSTSQLVSIVEALCAQGQDVLITRVDPDKAVQVREAHPDLAYSSVARTLRWTRSAPSSPFSAPVAIVSAGTSDQPVAEEASETLAAAGIDVERIYDVGVAGIHRLFEAMPRIEKAPVVIVVAGMEGALPSVVGGLIRAPVIAVPTSVGYGAAFDGVAALLGMLTGCASGMTVVNIDNGFGAAMAAIRMGASLARSRAQSDAGRETSEGGQ
jgi:NCAIR mutase (PurE)-related protein